MHIILKRICLIFFIFLSLFVSSRFSFAQSEDTAQYFDVQADLSYQVEASSLTRVFQKISIINKKEFVYAPSYSITLHINSIQDISVQNDTGKIPFTVKDNNNGTKTIAIDFQDRVVGIGAKNTFTFSFSSSDFARKTGGIYRVRIPALSNAKSFDTYTVHVTLPSGTGKPSIIKPDIPFLENGNTYTFSQNNLTNGGVELFFGDSQVYQFDLTYNLENKNVFPIKTEIALPSTTSYQEVLIQKVSPLPDNTYKDADGNTLATYVLPQKTAIKVRATVLIKTNSVPTTSELSEKDRKTYLQQQKYWETTDPEITKIARNLKTPEEIYTYVVKTLSYSDKKTAEENTRLGAKKVLTKPYFAVCLEFTDLFITLARSNGIPARAVEGYAYTQDNRDKPVSLFEDVLHAWPEYYDDTKKAWIMVDPTWGDTTQGTDFFHKLDFDHVAFTINGVKSTYPVPAGGYKTSEKDGKDIVMSFPDPSSFVKQNKTSISSSFSSFAHGNAIDGKITLKNFGNSDLSLYKVNLLLDGKKVAEVTLPTAPPLGESVVDVSIPIQEKNIIASLTNITHKITIQDEKGETLSSVVVRVLPFSEFLLLGGAILFAIGIILIIAIKTRSLHL